MSAKGVKHAIGEGLAGKDKRRVVAGGTGIEFDNVTLACPSKVPISVTGTLSEADWGTEKMTKRLRSSKSMLARFWQETAGIAAIEMALMAPLLVAAVVGAWDFGRLAMANRDLTSAASVGAQFGMQFPDDPVAIEQAVRDDMGSGGSSVSVTVASYCECPGSTTSVGCGTTCGVSTQPPQFMSVQVQSSFTTLFPYPYLTNPVIIIKQVVIRTR